MAGNFAKSHLLCYDFQKTFHSIDVFCTLNLLFVRLGFRLPWASLADQSVFESLICKSQRILQRVQWLCTRALQFFVHFLTVLYMTATCTMSPYRPYLGDKAYVGVNSLTLIASWLHCVLLPLGTFSNDSENVNVTDRKLGKRTSKLPRMPNRARLVVHISFRTSFAAICRLVENVSMFYLFSNFYLRILGISSM